MKGKILVTGGAGYIGSHVVNVLGRSGYDIVIVDNFSTGKKEAVLYGKMICEDIGNFDRMKVIFEEEKFDACIHMSGSIIVPESVEKPLPYYRNNTENSMSLIQLCCQFAVNKFIFSSTAAVYGDSDSPYCREDMPTNPANPYARSKLMTEWILQDVAASSGLEYVTLRYFNVAGANGEGLIGQSGPNSTHLIKVALECAVGKRERMEIFGSDYETADGTCIRDYIHVDDLAMAHQCALNYLSEGKGGDTFNCGYGKGYSVRDVVTMVKKVTGVDFPVDVVGRRDGDVPELIAVTDKIRSQTEWKPCHDDLEWIVRTAYEWEKKLCQK